MQKENSLQEPPELRSARSVPKSRSRNIPRVNLDTRTTITPPVVPDHKHSHAQSDESTRSAEAGRGDESRLVSGSILSTEDVARNKTHNVGQGHTDRGKRDTAAFVGNVVVVPSRQQDGGSRSSPAHHEGGKVGDVDLLSDVVDGGVDDEADESEDVAEDNKGETQARVIRAKGKDEQHHGAGDVGGHGVEVRLDGGVLQTRDDLGQEERDGLDGHAEADFDEQEAVGPGVGEDLEGLAEVELFGDVGRGVDLNTVESQGALILGQEFGLGGGTGEVEPGEDGEEESHAALDDEEVAPDEDLAVLDVEDAKGEQAGEGIGNVRRGVEDGQSSGQLATTVKGGEVVDDGREEGGLGHSKEPAHGEDAAEVLRGGGAEGHGAKGEHHDGQGARGSELLGQHGEGRCEDDVGHEEDRDDEVVLVGLEMKIYIKGEF